jgi:hypothetical protein
MAQQANSCGSDFLSSLEFFPLGRYVRMPDQRRGWGDDLVSTKHSIRGGQEKEAAAARSTGLRPIHFIHFIEAAVRNRTPNLLKE